MGFVTGAQNFDVVSLGDVVTDEFIRLPEGAVHVRVDDDGRWLEIPLGTKLVIEDDSLPATGGSARTRRWRWRDWGYEWAWPVISPTIKLGSTCSVRCAARTSTRASYTSIRRVTPFETLSSHWEPSGPSSCATPTSTTSGRFPRLRSSNLAVHQLPRPRRAGVPRRTRRLVGQFPERTTGLPTRHLPVGGGYQTTRSSLRQSRIAPLQPCRRQYHHWYFLERLEAPSR